MTAVGKERQRRQEVTQTSVEPCDSVIERHSISKHKIKQNFEKITLTNEYFRSHDKDEPNSEVRKFPYSKTMICDWVYASNRVFILNVCVISVSI